MTLLEALVETTKGCSVSHARLVHLAFSEDSDAYLSQIELEELVPLLERWCSARRAEMEMQEVVH